MSSPIGSERLVSPSALADELQGKIWGLIVDGVEYDAEFTGKISSFGDQIVKIKKKSKPS